MTAMSITSRMSIAEVARRIPSAIEIFEKASIDYCCRGARSLDDAAADAGLMIVELIAQLSALRPIPDEEPLSRVARFLINDHQACIEDHMPALRRVIDKALTAHGTRAPELARIERLFSRFAAASTSHMLDEEVDLLPLVAQLERARDGEAPAPSMRISHRVLGEMVEHEHIHQQLRTMRELAAQAAPECCVVELRAALERFSRLIHFHMHVENNILYPRAIEIENQLRRQLA